MNPPSGLLSPQLSCVLLEIPPMHQSALALMQGVVAAKSDRRQLLPTASGAGRLAMSSLSAQSV